MLDSYLIQAKNEVGERITAIIWDKKIGWVIYPSSKAVKDGKENKYFYFNRRRYSKYRIDSTSS